MTSLSASPATASATRIGSLDPLAEPLHRCALHLLRLVRIADTESGLSAARLSALSVLVFGGPCTLGTLARAERVSGPTMTRLVRGLEKQGWVRRSPAPHDRRVSLLTASSKAERLLRTARDRRLRVLSRGLPARETPEYRALTRALPALQRVVDSLANAATAASKKRVRRTRVRPLARSGRRRID